MSDVAAIATAGQHATMSEVGRRRRRDLVGVAALAGLLLALTLLVRAPYHQTLLVFCAIHAIAAVGLSLLLGYAGQISLGQGAFFGFGAYLSADLVQKLGWPPLASLPVTAVAAAALGWLLARPLLKLSGHYLAMATLAIAVVAFITFGQLQPLTGGFDPGIVGLPPVRVGTMSLARPGDFFPLAALVLVGAVWFSLNVVDSAFGRGLRALRGSEVAAAGLGVDVAADKARVFALAAGLTGLSGGLYALFQRSFNASAFDPLFSIELLMMAILGSVRSVWGALFGAVFVTLMPAFLDGFDEVRTLAYGLLIVVVMIFCPEGLADAAWRGLRAMVGRARSLRSGSAPP